MFVVQVVGLDRLIEALAKIRDRYPLLRVAVREIVPDLYEIEVGV
mgnify:CR=1 FL=1